MTGLAFAAPWAALLLVLPVLARLLPPRRSERPALTVPPRLAAAFGQAPAPAGTPRAVTVLTALAFLAFVVAAMRPSLPLDAVRLPVSGRDLMMVVDLSGSMERRDFALDGVEADRLSVVKRVAGDFLEKREGDRLGLVLFADEAHVAAPLSHDRAAVAAYLREASIGLAGRATAIGDALGLAVKRLRKESARAKVVVLLSDGTNNAGSVEPEDAARLAAKEGVRVHAVGMGSRAAGEGADPSADLDEATLARIAEATGGRYFRAATTADLAAVHAEIDALERAERLAPPVVLRRELTLRPLALSVLLLALAGLVAARRAVP